MENKLPIDDQGVSDIYFLQIKQLQNQLFHERGINAYGTNSVAIKSSQQDVFGDEIQVLHTLNSIQNPDTVISYNLTKLSRIVEIKNPSSEKIKTALTETRLKIEDPPPDFVLLFHAVIPSPVTVFYCPAFLMAVDMCENGHERLRKLFHDQIVWFDEKPGFDLAKKLAASPDIHNNSALFIHHLGLFVFGPDINSVFDQIILLKDKVNDAHIIPAIPNKDNLSRNFSFDVNLREKIADLRKELSLSAGTPLLTQVVHHQNLHNLLDKPTIINKLFNGPRTYHQAVNFGDGFLDPDTLPEALPLDNALIHREFGLVVTGHSVSELNKNCHLASEILDSIYFATLVGDLDAQTPQKVLKSPLKQRQMKDKSSMFIGEVALVTGAASGIGRGCALSLLDRGSVVVGLDINPKIKTISKSPAYLGLECDLLDETAVKQAFETTVRTFGGLDMIVLNAGIFTNSVLIQDLDIALWHKVMNINLDANVILLREAYPLLKKAPANGRVLVNASRNVPAPGPGAAPYSTSKAGLTQLARIAALEWGKDGIRVNIIHPHAVFDTGIWTKEVLESRAAKYGISVQEYKTNNVLKVELTCKDIGELVCEMLGPVFSKTTGAQVPVDGGCERVI